MVAVYLPLPLVDKCITRPPQLGKLQGSNTIRDGDVAAAQTTLISLQWNYNVSHQYNARS